MSESGGTNKRKRITSLTRGNKQTFQQQQDPSARRKTLIGPILDPMTDHEVVTILTNLSHCCGRGGESGCFCRIFTHNNCVNYTDAIEHFRHCRGKTANLTPDEKSNFIHELYKSSVAEVRNQRNKISFQLFGQPVCRSTIFAAYGISKHSFSQSTQNYKTAQGM
jgi:hypothetical protein